MKSLDRRQFLKGAAGLLGATLLAACGEAGTAPTATAVGPAASPTAGAVATAQQANMVRFAWWSDSGSMTPFAVSAAGPGGAVLLSLIFDTLTWKDERGSYHGSPRAGSPRRTVAATRSASFRAQYGTMGRR